MNLFWFIPTGGDGRYLATSEQGRATKLGYMQQIAKAVDDLGFTGALLPTGRFCEDPWVVASALAANTRFMKFLVAVRPGLMAPALAARMAASLDRISDGRLLINVVTGGSDADSQADGISFGHDERYEVTDEFLSIWRGITGGEKVDYAGDYLQIKGGHLGFPTVQRPYPPLYFGGSSPAAHRVAAKHADMYLTWGEPPHQVAEQIKTVRALAAEQGRTVRFGIRLHIIVRETEREAWQAADNLIRYVDDKTIAASQAQLQYSNSVGQARMTALHNGKRDNLEVSPNLWAGVGLVRGGAGTALVGTPEVIVERMLEYADLGVDTFIFSGYPHLEEAYRVADLLFPHLPVTSPQAPHYDANSVFRPGDRFTQIPTAELQPARP